MGGEPRLTGHVDRVGFDTMSDRLWGEIGAILAECGLPTNRLMPRSEMRHGPGTPAGVSPFDKRRTYG